MSGSSHIEAQISGDVRGQVAVGNYIIQNNVDHGGIVFVGAPGEMPIPRLRAMPIRLGGRVPAIVGRRAELASIVEVLSISAPVALHGPSGIGKTALLKAVIGRHGEEAPDTSVVYHSAIGEPPSDTLQFLFDAFYESSVPFKPTPAQLRLALAVINGLLVFDDVAWDRDQATAILDAVPSATALCASTQQCLWGTGLSIAVTGLSDDDAVVLLSRELGRTLAPDEVDAAHALTAAVDREPLAVLQLASLVRRLGQNLIRLEKDFRGSVRVGQEVMRRLSASLTAEERLVLDALEAAGGAALTAKHLATLTGLPAVQPSIDALVALRLAQQHSPRYSATRPPPPGGDAVRATIACLDAHGDDVEQVLELAGAIALSIRSATAREDWEGVLALGRLAESGLILGRRWGAWAEVLQAQRHAATVLGRPHAEAWALHQLGTRALCLGDLIEAEEHLRQALEMRETLGDEPGASATRHNLELLGSPGPSSAPQAYLPSPTHRPFRRRMLFLAVAAGIALLLLLAWAASRSTRDPTAAPRPARLVAVDADVDFGSASVGTRSAIRSVRFTNGGDQSLRDLRLVVDGDQRSEFIIGTSTCQGTVPGRATCRVDITFGPAGVGLRQAVLRETGDARLAVQLTGRGVEPIAPAPFARADQGRLDFAEAPLLRPSAAQRVQIANAGVAALLVTSVRVDGDDASDFTINDECAGSTVTAGGMCSVQVVFSAAAPGARRGRLVVGVAGGDPIVVELTGAGRMEPVVPDAPLPPVRPPAESLLPLPPPPILLDTGEERGGAPVVAGSVEAEPTTLDFGSNPVGSTSAPRTFRVSSPEMLDPQVFSVLLNGEDAGDFAIVADDCGAVGVVPADGCAVAVTFAPRSTGPRTASVEVSLTGNASISIAVIGVGLGLIEPAPGTLLAVRQSLDFGTVRIGSTSSRATLTVINTGGSPLDMRGIVVEGRADYAVEDLTCIPEAPSSPAGATVLLPGGICVVTVRFTPSESGLRLGTLVLAPVESTPLTVALQGIGELPPQNTGGNAFGTSGIGGSVPGAVSGSLETGESNG